MLRALHGSVNDCTLIQKSTVLYVDRKWRPAGALSTQPYERIRALRRRVPVLGGGGDDDGERPRNAKREPPRPLISGVALLAASRVSDALRMAIHAIERRRRVRDGCHAVDAGSAVYGCVWI